MPLNREDPTSEYVVTTLARLLAAIEESTETDEESFAVLASLLAGGRISIVGETQSRSA